MTGPYCTCGGKILTQFFTYYRQRAHGTRHQINKRKIPQELETIKTEQYINSPMEEEEINQLSACHTWIDHKDGKIHTDMV